MSPSLVLQACSGIFYESLELGCIQRIVEPNQFLASRKHYMSTVATSETLPASSSLGLLSDVSAWYALQHRIGVDVFSQDAQVQERFIDLLYLLENEVLDGYRPPDSDEGVAKAVVSKLSERYAGRIKQYIVLDYPSLHEDFSYVDLSIYTLDGHPFAAYINSGNRNEAETSIIGDEPGVTGAFAVVADAMEMRNQVKLELRQAAMLERYAAARDPAAIVTNDVQKLLDRYTSIQPLGNAFYSVVAPHQTEFVTKLEGRPAWYIAPNGELFQVKAFKEWRSDSREGHICTVETDKGTLEIDAHDIILTVNKSAHDLELEFLQRATAHPHEWGVTRAIELRHTVIDGAPSVLFGLETVQHFQGRPLTQSGYLQVSVPFQDKLQVQATLRALNSLRGTGVLSKDAAELLALAKLTDFHQTFAEHEPRHFKQLDSKA